METFNTLAEVRAAVERQQADVLRTFDKWCATLPFGSPDNEAARLEYESAVARVNEIYKARLRGS